MTFDETLTALADHIGIFRDFVDLQGKVRTISPDTQRALLRANGLDVANVAVAADTLSALRASAAQRYLPPDVVIRVGEAALLDIPDGTTWRITLENSTQEGAEGRSTGQAALPPLPIGVHRLDLDGPRGVQQATLIVSPDAAPLVRDLAGGDKIWGAVAALYGVQSGRASGLGDFTDLAELAATLGRRGAGFLGINPVHALGWADPSVISPYSPTHRGFLNTRHLALDDIPGARFETGLHHGDKLIDYAAYDTSHRAAVLRAYEHFRADGGAAEKAAFSAYCASAGQSLTDFALFERLSEDHGPDWRHWPAALQTPESAAGAKAAAGTEFHKWLQWQADQQLANAQIRAQASGMALGLYLDLAVGARQGGAESWCAQHALAAGVSVGAPPDHLSPAGQNWQLAAYAPYKLTRQKYAAFRQVLQQTMRHAGVLRIDHALGMNRSYWVPYDGSPGGFSTVHRGK